MNAAELVVNQLTEISALITAAEGRDALLQNLNQVSPDLQFSCALSRGGWYRIGGVVNAEGKRIADNLTTWAEQESDGDINALLDTYADTDFYATRLNGQTHYLVASSGPGAADFIQLEVEELQEELDRMIVDPDWQPDTVEEFVDPIDYPRLDPKPIGSPRYLFRCITPVAAYLDKLADGSESPLPIQRFFQDWENSSAGEAALLCHKWVLNLREYTDGYGEPVKQVHPISTYTETLAELDPDASVHGATLANLIHDFDRSVGYPMAWYFYLLTRKKVSPRAAEAIHNDLIGAYDYLPPRDLKILNAWIANPYTV
jgi:hypothetical protein